MKLENNTEKGCGCGKPKPVTPPVVSK